MFNLCIGDLAEITGGQLRLASMPPLAGTWEPVHRIVLDSHDAGPGDVYWAVSGRYFEGGPWAEDAFARGALGAVVSRRRIEPWAGKFALQVEDANRALFRLAKCFAKARGSRDWLCAASADPRRLLAALAREDATVLEDFTMQLVRRGYTTAA